MPKLVYIIIILISMINTILYTRTHVCDEYLAQYLHHESSGYQNCPEPLKPGLEPYSLCNIL